MRKQIFNTRRARYIGLGTALIAAAEVEVDCTPMEGFDPAALDEILDLRSRGLRKHGDFAFRLSRKKRAIGW